MGVYEKFFNFRTKPFELVPNPDFLYVSRTHRKAITHLSYGIKEKTGFMLLTGDVGSGKTTIIRDLLKKMDARVNVSKVFNTKVNSEQMIAMINDDFGLDIKGKDKVGLLKDLYDFLIEQYSRGSHSVLIIDEAQNLTADLLEEVRMLSNLETDSAKLLQIILAGQPELRRTLARPEIRQLRQRISISCHILPLNRRETEEYIFHRLEVAGNGKAVRFLDEAMDVIHGFSRGIPRFINIICDFLLLSAYAEDTRDIGGGLVREVVGEIEAENCRPPQDELHSGAETRDDKDSPGMEGRLERIERQVYRTNELLMEFVVRTLASEADGGKSRPSEARRIIMDALKKPLKGFHREV